MNDNEIISDILGKGGIAGLLVVAVWYVTKKLTTTYEARIAALEKASEVCEKDRVELRNLILDGLSKNGATFNPTKKPE